MVVEQRCQRCRLIRPCLEVQGAGLIIKAKAHQAQLLEVHERVAHLVIRHARGDRWLASPPNELNDKKDHRGINLRRFVLPLLPIVVLVLLLLPVTPLNLRVLLGVFLLSVLVILGIRPHALLSVIGSLVAAFLG